MRKTASQCLYTKNGPILLPVLCAFVAVGAACFVGTPARAEAGVAVKPSIRQDVVWDSNPLMRVRKQKDLFGSQTEPRVQIQAQGARTNAAASLWLVENLYNQSNFNSTDYHVTSMASRKTQKAKLGMMLGGDYDTTRTSELTLFGTETGTIRHIGAFVAPEVSYALSPRSQMQLAGSYRLSRYDGSSNQDYHILGLTPSYARNFTEKYVGIFSLSAQRYETDEGVSRTIDRVGPSVGGEAVLTPKTTLRLSIGVEASQERSQSRIVQDWTLNHVFSSQLNFTGDQDVVRVSATRAQQAFSNGNESLLTTFSVRESRTLHPRLTLNVGASYQKADYGVESSGNLDALYSADTGFVYHVTKDLDVSSTYKYKNESRTGGGKVARQNAMMIGLVYRP